MKPQYGARPTHPANSPAWRGVQNTQEKEACPPNRWRTSLFRSQLVLYVAHWRRELGRARRETHAKHPAHSVIDGPGSPFAAKVGRPNVLVILTDDLRHDAMSCAGHPWFKTPNIDRLAAEGARFTNAFVTTSLCSPSRASLLSGLYAHRHKVLNNFTDYPERPAQLSAPAAGGRLRDGLHRQVAHGRADDDQQRPGFDLLDEPQGPGQLLRQRVQHQRHSGRPSRATTPPSSPTPPSTG